MDRLCWHDWNKWSELVQAYDGVWQHRTCKECNKASKRRAGDGNNYNLSLWNTQDKAALEGVK